VPTRTVDVRLAAWRTRARGTKLCPYLVVDAQVERVRWQDQVRGTTALRMMGVGGDGWREHVKGALALAGRIPAGRALRLRNQRCTAAAPPVDTARATPRTPRGRRD
jgi:hypothetical protein